MKKQLAHLALISTFAIAPAYANQSTNACIENIEDHHFYNFLGLDDCKLTDSDIPQVISYLNQHPDIEILSLMYNQIGI